MHPGFRILTCSLIAAALSAAAQDQQLDLDLKGGSELQFTDGSRLWLTEDGMRLDGKPITCGELKLKQPALFRGVDRGAPLFDENCRIDWHR